MPVKTEWAELVILNIFLFSSYGSQALFWWRIVAIYVAQHRCPCSRSINQRGRGKLSLTFVYLFLTHEFHSSGSFREWPLIQQTSFGDEVHIYRRLGLPQCHIRKYLSISNISNSLATTGEIVNQIGNPYNKTDLIVTLYKSSLVFWGRCLVLNRYESVPAIRFAFCSFERGCSLNFYNLLKVMPRWNLYPIKDCTYCFTLWYHWPMIFSGRIPSVGSFWFISIKFYPPSFIKIIYQFKMICYIVKSLGWRCALGIN